MSKRACDPSLLAMAVLVHGMAITLCYISLVICRGYVWLVASSPLTAISVVGWGFRSRTCSDQLVQSGYVYQSGVHISGLTNEKGKNCILLPNTIFIHG